MASSRFAPLFLVFSFVTFLLPALQAKTWSLGFPEKDQVVFYRTITAKEFKSFQDYENSPTLLLHWRDEAGKHALPVHFLKNPDQSYDLFLFASRFEVKHYESLLTGFEKSLTRKKIRPKVKTKKENQFTQAGQTLKRGLSSWGLNKKPYFFVFLVSSFLAQFAYENAINDHNAASTQPEVDRTYKKVQAYFDFRNVLTGATITSLMMRF